MQSTNDTVNSDENFDEIATLSDVDFLGDLCTQSTSNDALNARSKFLPKAKIKKLPKIPDVVQGSSSSSNTSCLISSTSSVSETNPSQSGHASFNTNDSNTEAEAPSFSNLEFIEDSSFKHSFSADTSFLTDQDPENGFPESESLLPETDIDSVRVDGILDGEEAVGLSTFSSSDNASTQPFSNLACSSGKFHPKLSSRTKDQQLECNPSARVSFHPDTELLECHNQTSGLPPHLDLSAREKGLLTEPKHAKKVNFLNESLVQGVDETFASGSAEEAPRKSSRLRKNIQYNMFDEDEDEGDTHNGQSGNLSPLIDAENQPNNCNDGGHIPETGRHEKRSKIPLNGTEKSTQKRKQHTATPGSGEEIPVKKKFSHSTRRTRRQVDKKLLETPEQEIDVRKLRLKDLILLTEARERMSVKAQATDQPQDNRSHHHYFNYDPYGENADMEESDPYIDDEEVNLEAKIVSSKLNYHTYMKRSSSSRWTKMETEMFYQAIRQFGTDFTMIQQLFPDRTRHQVRLKFKNEERKHPLQIADAITHPSKDYSHFEEVIQRLKAREEEEGRKELEIYGEADSQDAIGAHAGSEVKKSDGEEQGANEMDGYNPGKYDNYFDSYDWDDIRNAHGQSPYTGKDDFDDTY